MNELTREEVAAWFNLNHTDYYMTTSSSTKTITKDAVRAYVQKLELRVMRLASKLADQD